MSLFSALFVSFLVYAAIAVAALAALLLPILFWRDQRSRKIW